jgi:hypothetical protein
VSEVEQPTWKTAAAWRELVEGLTALDQTFLAGPKAVGGDEQAVAEGYRFLATILGVALDSYLFVEPTNPTFVDVNTPARRDRQWGGDNTDAYYCSTPIDPNGSYRVWGNKGDSAYFSMTVYNEPSPGAWSDRIVAIVNDTDLSVDADGNFEFVVGPVRPDGYDDAFVAIDESAAVLFTRDYQVDPRLGRRIDWHIEPLQPPKPVRHSDADTAARLRTALTWIKTMFAIVPLEIAPRESDLTLGHNVPQVANEFAAPYQVMDSNYGWSARDACYSFGSFVLEADEALVVTHRPPACRFWNVIVWNQFMAGHSIDDERTSLNHAGAVPNRDGSVTVVIARQLLSHPNAISTVDHRGGVAAFRWFLADQVPEPPHAVVIKAADAPTAVM